MYSTMKLNSGMGKGSGLSNHRFLHYSSGFSIYFKHLLSWWHSKATYPSHQIPLQGMQRPPGRMEWPEHTALSLPDASDAAMLDLVLADRTLYLADAGHATVDVFRMDKGRLLPRSPAVRLPAGDSVTSLAVDWITLSLYWSSSQQPRIHVTSAQNRHTITLLADNLEAPSAIALHPPAGWLCFADLGLPGSRRQPRVECAFMDGRNRTLTWGKAVMPTSLTFSPQGSELYWADVGENFSKGLDRMLKF